MNMQDLKAGLLRTLGQHRVDRRLVLVLGMLGLLLLIGAPGLAISDLLRQRAAAAAAAEAQIGIDSVSLVAKTLQQALDDRRVGSLALQALEDPARLAELRGLLQQQVAGIDSVQVFPPDVGAFDPGTAGANGYALLDMMLVAAEGLRPPLQLHAALAPPRLVDLAAVRVEDRIAAFVAMTVDPAILLDRFSPDSSGLAYLRLTQNNGRQPAGVLKELGQPVAGEIPQRLPVPGTLFRVEMPPAHLNSFFSASSLLTTLAAGLLMLGAAAVLRCNNEEWARRNPPTTRAVQFARTTEVVPPAEPEPQAASADTREREPGPRPLPAAAVAEEPPPPPMRLHYDVAERQRSKPVAAKAVGLTAEIFRAYDIRGVIGRTLDAGIARSVGQVVGTLAREKNAGPVVVARDGRLSGPELVAGMVDGIASSGCDVLDIGAVPTGVLYFAAHELAAGTGVMITGSHNPPDYNGFKIMLAGDTLYGQQIREIHRRIRDGQVMSGTGRVERTDVLARYRQRIASDIKLQRPLRVVIDCGNGIGGVCAADVLRDIGAEVLPLFEEVDGTFPNHHPDPSEPHNLEDLISSVKLMDADLGLALDGDADRLGVVTMHGSIIYPDRVMMLLAMDVLDRVPGATIIYDVKCTGKLAEVIEKAGGKPLMYKTGHSLIKAKMKEIGSPFAGEMSGHFFFGERWYGVDDGIYAAARLLEILASAEAPPEAILTSLPSSFTTPELKVQMSEGQNHAFIDELQAQARFEGATVSTIDGVRADYPDGWGLVRASNTTPILVVRFDAETEEALKRIKNIFRARMLAINPDLVLPF